GRGQYGHVWLEVEPNQPGKGIEFQDKIVGGSVPREYIGPTEHGVREALESGILGGYPVVDIIVKLVDGSFHPVDSSEMAFRTAGSMAVKEAIRRAAPVFLEPIMKVEITTPKDFFGDVLGDLNKRRAHIMETDQRGHMEIIRA